MNKRTIFLLAFLLCCLSSAFSQHDDRVRIGIDGLTHDHIHSLLNGHKDRTDIVIVGIAESNRELAEKYARQYGYNMDMVYDNVDAMIDATHPEGVMAFNSIYDHLSTVIACAPHGIHVMLEKPLAVDGDAALRMAELAAIYDIHLLTNYETTWYPAHYKAFAMAVEENAFGDINKVMIQDGHKGPVEIGCSPEFLAWLTDPVLNGGGAVIDFGCYGANLMTWLMGNEEPLSVTALLQQIKPDVYPQVDDQATIILEYPKTQAVIQGSWSWPLDRKDMEIYGRKGYIKVKNDKDVEYCYERFTPIINEKVEVSPYAKNNPFSYFADVIRGRVEVAPTDLSSLNNNLIVVKILDAARESAAQGKTIKLK